MVTFVRGHWICIVGRHPDYQKCRANILWTLLGHELLQTSCIRLVSIFLHFLFRILFRLILIPSAAKSMEVTALLSGDANSHARNERIITTHKGLQIVAMSKIETIRYTIIPARMITITMISKNNNSSRKY